MRVEDMRGRVIDCLLRVYPGHMPHSPPIPPGALRDSASLEMERPGQLIDYLFKGDVSERVKLSLDPARVEEELDHWGIDKIVTLVEDADAERTLTRLSQHRGRFNALLRVNPHEGMNAIRRIEALAREFAIVKALSISPLSIYPFITPNSKECYPVYAKAVELDLPVFVNVGIPGPRVPGNTQNPIHLDEVCWFFPDLKVVMLHGGEPWTDLCVKLMLKWPHLYYATSAISPKYYSKDIVEYANTRGADKILYAGYWPTLSFDVLFEQLSKVPFRDHVWPKFLHQNARRVLKFDAA